jgi:hypothetical protein
MNPAEHRRLRTVLFTANLGWLFERNLDVLLQRLDAFAKTYTEKTLLVSGFPRMSSVADLLKEYESNRHRVDALLQALAFNCSDEILAMIWAVLMGAKIERLSYEYERRQTSRLVVEVTFPDGTEGTFTGKAHWDVAALRLAGLSKADDLPLIESFYPLYLPRLRGSNFSWIVRVLEWVNTSGGTPAVCPSVIDAEHLPEIADAVVDAVKEGWLEARPGSKLAAARADERAAGEARELLALDEPFTAKVTEEGRRAIRRGRFYVQLRPASASALNMIKKEIERVLSDSRGYDQDEIQEIRDELYAVERLLAEAP